MDYRKFLQQEERLVLPYFGGSRVDAPSRRLRVSVVQPAGWYAFSVKGRVATPVDVADVPDLSGLPAVRGHFAHGWLFSGGQKLARVELLVGEEPAVLSPLVARRWHSGDLVFDSVEFESEAEDAVRQALERELDIDQVKGVAASLRAAYAFALIAKVAARLDIAVSPRECMGVVLSVSSAGAASAEAFLLELVERRRLERVRLDAWAASEGVVRPQTAPARPEPRVAPYERAGRALDAAGADLVGHRTLDGGLLEVTYRFMGERFISIVEQDSLQVVDAGICLSGSDRAVTLESLPSVIREGFDTQQLNITRRA